MSKKINTSESSRAFKDAQTFFPGGVNSPVRAFGSVGGTPIFFDKAKGSRVWDIDGNEYIDFVASWGPAILGHSNDEVIEAVKQAAEKGLSFGAPTVLESKLGKKISEMVPSIEMMRLVSSGTEVIK